MSSEEVRAPSAHGVGGGNMKIVDMNSGIASNTSIGHGGHNTSGVQIGNGSRNAHQMQT